MREKGGDRVLLTLFWCYPLNQLILHLVFIVFLFALQVEQSIGQTYCEEKPKILFYHKGQTELVSGGRSVSGGGDNSNNNADGGGSASDNRNNLGDNHVLISNVNKEFLVCVSSRNVEWDYEGEGEPSKFQESSTVDIQKYDDGSISYCLTSQITFSNKQSDTELSKHTGRYSCREIGNQTNIASVYVFASRKNSPMFVQSRKALTLPVSSENITVIPLPPMKQAGRRSRMHKINSNNTFIGVKPEKLDPVPTPILTIPCVTTRPVTSTSVRLLKKQGKSNSFTTFKGAPHVFDPKYGFRLNVSLANREDLSEFYGDYKCVSRTSSGSASGGGRSVEQDLINRNTEDFVLISLVKPKSFQAFPPVSEVYTSGMLNLTCESEEPVIMKEVVPHTSQDLYAYLDEDDYGRDRSDEILETTEKTEQKTHVANYLEIAPAAGRTGEIQCLTEKEGKLLHSWRYRIIRKRADKLSGIKFNKREQSFTCKTKLGAPGSLSFISCRTPSECKVNAKCLEKSRNCRGYSNATRAFCERKTHHCGKLFYKGGSGLIRCIGEGLDEIRGFTDEAATDQAVRMGFGKLRVSETALLRLTGIESRSEGGINKTFPLHQTPLKGGNKEKEEMLIFEGDRVNVTLRMGYYYFLYPVQWAVKFKNGSIMQLNADLQNLQVEKLSRTVYASLTIPYTSATTFLKENGISAIKNNGSSSSSSSNGKEEKGNNNKTLSEIVALHALIPLRSSVEPSWKTISLPLTVYGKIGAPPLPSDNDGEDLLAEQASNDKGSSKSSDDDEDTEAVDDEESEDDGGGFQAEEGKQEGAANNNKSTTSSLANSESTTTTLATTATSPSPSNESGTTVGKVGEEEKPELMKNKGNDDGTTSSSTSPVPEVSSTLSGSTTDETRKGDEVVAAVATTTTRQKVVVGGTTDNITSRSGEDAEDVDRRGGGVDANNASSSTTEKPLSSSTTQMVSSSTSMSSSSSSSSASPLPPSTSPSPEKNSTAEEVRNDEGKKEEVEDDAKFLARSDLLLEDDDENELDLNDGNVDAITRKSDDGLETLTEQPQTTLSIPFHDDDGNSNVIDGIGITTENPVFNDKSNSNDNDEDEGTTRTTSNDDDAILNDQRGNEMTTEEILYAGRDFETTTEIDVVLVQ